MYTHMCMINIRMCMFVCWDNSVRHWMASVYIFWVEQKRRGGRQLGNRRPSEEKSFKAGFGCGPSPCWTDPEHGLTHGRKLEAEKTSRQEILLKDAGKFYFSAVKQNWASQKIRVFEKCSNWVYFFQFSQFCPLVKTTNSQLIMPFLKSGVDLFSLGRFIISMV